MSTDIKGPSPDATFDGSGLRVAIVHARWNRAIIVGLVSGAIKKLKERGVKEENIVIASVPGSFELPLACSKLIAGSRNGRESKPLDAVIAVGVLIKGETMHFEYISDAVTHALMKVQLDSGIPIIFGVLTALTQAQALERAGLSPTGAVQGHNHGEDWGLAAVEMGMLANEWNQGV